MNFRIHSFTHQINATRIKGIMAIRRSYLIRIREVQQFALRYMKTDVDKLLGQAEKQKEEACISVYEQADLQTEP